MIPYPESDSDSDDDLHPHRPQRALLQPSQDPSSKPLIDRVTNEWRNRRPSTSEDSDDSHYFSRDSDYEDWPPRLPRWVHNVKPPVIPRKVQRYFVLFIVIVTISWTVFARWIHPVWMEEEMLDKAFETAMRAAENDAASFSPGATYGSNVEIELDGLIQLKSLPKKHLPQSSRHHENRLIIIGDVHGCKTELLKLLSKADFNRKHDHLIFVGDVVNKGPDSPGVVDVLRDLGASCVRGNHEDKVLLHYDDIHSRPSPIAGTAEEEQLEKERYSKSERRARMTARSLSKEQARWLKECPVILNVGKVERMGELNVVHAGLVPGVKLKRQDPFQVMNMRTMDPETRVPSENRDQMHWEKIWNHWQKSLPEKERSTVLYGHDSKRGLNIKKWTKGLDSGCVNGGSLTALVIDGKGEQEVVHVKCAQDNRTD